MVEFKLTISTKDGKTAQKAVSDDNAKVFMGKKIGDTVNGDACGIKGYEFEITGGSDDGGFPMRKDLPGIKRKRILTTRSKGVHIEDKGIKARKTVRGNTIDSNVVQINLKVLKEGAEKIVHTPSEKKK